MGPTLPSGSRIAGFRIESLLGRGAMAEVYRAHSEASGDIVALKLLDETLGRDERFRQRFLRESEIAEGLDHPNVVRTLGSGEDGGRLFLAMTLVEGTDLRQLLRDHGALEPERAVDIVAQVASALDAAHKAGLIHRDVKPGNILVADDRAYVCDFGLARHVSSASSLTGDRGFVGTIDYVPPEQIEGAQLDGRADLYSLGCVLYECLAGQRPFERDSELSVVFAHLNEPPPQVTEVRPELPAAFDEVIATGLAKKPADRYESCGELAAAARAALRGKRRRRRKPLRLVAAAIVVAAAAAGAIVAGVLATRGGGHAAVSTGPPPIRLAPNALSLIDARSNRVTGHVPLGRPTTTGAGYDVVANGRFAWVLVVAEQKLLRVDLRTSRVSRAVRLPWVPAGRIAWGGGFVWATQDGGPGVFGASLGSRPNRRFAVHARNGVGVAYGAGSLWLEEGDRVARVDPRTGRVLAHVIERGQAGQPGVLAFARGWLWEASENVVRKIDPVSNSIITQGSVNGAVRDMAVDLDVWVTLTPDDVLVQLSEDDLTVIHTTPAGRDPERLSFGGGRVWIANAIGATVSSVSPASRARVARRVTAKPQIALLSGRLLLVAATAIPRPLPPIKGDEIRVSTPDQAVYPDPAGPRTPQTREVEYATCANLLGYPDADGAAGGSLVPEVATAMPAMSADGRTYTFRIRPGFRFSPPSNQPVTAETFRFSIERAFRPTLRGWAGSDLHDIVGLGAFTRGRAKHISGIAARGNTLRITLSEPDGAFPLRISQPEFCPVPIGTAIVPDSVAQPIPRDGPYYVASISHERTVLLRNPNYGGTRPRKPVRIVYSTGVLTPKAVSLVDRGELDYLPDGGNAGPLVSGGGLLDHRYGPGSKAARRGDQRYLHRATPAWHGVVLNASRPLFRSLRMRRAVQYALDRVALSRVSFPDVPGESLVPPAVGGFGHAAIYPLRGNLATARRLAGRTRRTATLYYCTNGVFGGGWQLQPAVLIRRQLTRIGITVRIMSPDCPGDDRDDATARRADLILAADFDTLLDPENFVAGVAHGDFHHSALGPGLWSEPRFTSRLNHAHLLNGAVRIAAFKRLEDDLLRAAPVAVWGSWDDSMGYFSPRVGCRIVPPGVAVIDLGALCKK